MNVDHVRRSDVHPLESLPRRRFLGATAGLASLLLGPRHVIPAAAVHHGGASCGAAPRPIPGGFRLSPGGEIFHAFGFAPGLEPSTITDFKGFVGNSRIRGTGQGTPDSGVPLVFQADTRFMTGEYVGIDDQRHHGTFGFI